MKQTANAFFLLLLFTLAATAIFLSARTTIQFPSQLDRPSATPKPTPIAKPTPVATGALRQRSGRLPS